MSKPIGYWGCNYDHQLIRDIAETYGDHLQHMRLTDKYWLQCHISEAIRLEIWEVEETQAAEEAGNSLHEMDQAQLQALSLALINKSHGKPITYWGCDHLNPIINGLIQVYGQYLEAMSNEDCYWLLMKIGHYLWLNHSDNAPTEEAQEVYTRITELELPFPQWDALLTAIVNS
ncbi:hypothetical protein NIES4101_33960 [Calothrix sp. NIES-4101]|nr:hypothetical protein NIES4101_33960 [Calothrix sp. NIES-4101]